MIDEEEIIEEVEIGGEMITATVYRVRGEWWEYKIEKPDATWDSLIETYNGVQKMTKDQAIKAAKDFMNDIKEMGWDGAK